MAIQDCLHNARLAGDITEQEEAELLQRLKELDRDGVRGAQRKAHLEKELRGEAVERQRVRLLQANAVSASMARLTAANPLACPRPFGSRQASRISNGAASHTASCVSFSPRPVSVSLISPSPT